jgi:hypothetical protein
MTTHEVVVGASGHTLKIPLTDTEGNVPVPVGAVGVALQGASLDVPGLLLNVVGTYNAATKEAEFAAAGLIFSPTQFGAKRSAEFTARVLWSDDNGGDWTPKHIVKFERLPDGIEGNENPMYDYLSGAQILAQANAQASAGWRIERRRRLPRTFKSVAELDTVAYTTGGSFVENVDSNFLSVGPQIWCGAGRIAVGPNELAVASEHYNYDPFTYSRRPKVSDHMWALPMYADTLVFPAQVVQFPSAGAMTGFSIGNLESPNFTGAASQNSVRLSIAFRHDDKHWQVEVCNRWAASGHKQKIVDLGTLTPDIPQPATGVTCRLEIAYYPNDRVEFYIDGRLVKTFTDAADGGGDTPLADIYSHEATFNSTIGGLCIWTTTGSGAGGRTEASFVLPYIETVMEV